MTSAISPVSLIKKYELIPGEIITLSKVDIKNNNSNANGIISLADELNRYASRTGISGTAIVETTTRDAIQAGSTGKDFAINGINIGAISVLANDRCFF